MQKDTVVILDFGSQYNQLIARRVRECKVYSVLMPYSASIEKIKSYNPKAIILTGGPASVMKKGSPKADPRIFKLGVPILGICYGMQFTAYVLGGKVGKSKKREYGYSELILNKRDQFFSGFEKKEKVWMSHGDKVQEKPKGFIVLAHTKNSHIASMADPVRKIYGVQFHPEVIHTPRGMQIFKNFLYDIAGLKPTWTMSSFIKNSIEEIKQKVGSELVVLGLSGGVDSSVAAMLLHKAIGPRLHCIFVDNGLLRKYEREYVEKTFREHFHINLHIAKSEKRFLKKLKGVTDPERKRRIIGMEFIKVFEEESKKIGNVKFLGQGTLYPDVIESVSAKGGPSATIKTHHNVGGLPKKMNLKLIEPLRGLFKDEVRLLGKELKLPDIMVHRQPFPGPGLAVRIISDITKERLEILRDADLIVQEEMEKYNGYKNIWQSFAVLLPVKSVGVMGDERTYENVAALRMVTSQDAMTADWAKVPYEILGRISNRIINEVKGVNRVVYDISSKPPATIEWE
ncbi:MAG: glutamine-hydrolyzing GMP synthase [Omnitrophica bacterium GWA2_41_15]|nr:MAG: glutamine-hydrolyzing GMP synthase [Omnitrophica bacterium GWA2_41_15]HAZ11066.1 GMP synthase (glutamine-hydrolyzing) [Candidatus Omnitrophota bacterium]